MASTSFFGGSWSWIIWLIIIGIFIWLLFGGFGGNFYGYGPSGPYYGNYY